VCRRDIKGRWFHNCGGNSSFGFLKTEFLSLCWIQKNRFKLAVEIPSFSRLCRISSFHVVVWQRWQRNEQRIINYYNHYNNGRLPAVRTWSLIWKEADAAVKGFNEKESEKKSSEFYITTHFPVNLSRQWKAIDLSCTLPPPLRSLPPYFSSSLPPSLPQLLSVSCKLSVVVL